MAGADLASRTTQVLARCEELAAFSEDADAITRPYGSDALAGTIARVETWMHEAGLATRRDAAGSLIGRLPAASPAAPTFLLGSHLDSVRDAGRYDGPLGVLAALSAVEAIASRPGLPLAFEVVAFADEEGLRFGTAYLASAAFVGAFDPAWLNLTDANGISLREACAALGGDPEALARGLPPPAGLLGYLELHIEQGPELEALGTPVAVVSAIAGQSRIAVGLRGEAGHAGTVPVHRRRDALAGAAEVVLAVERLARATPRLVATIGELEISPGASNVIPGAARLTIDVRSPDDVVREAAIAALHRSTVEIAERRRLGLEWDVRPGNPAVAMDPALSERLAAAVTACGLHVHRLPSGAGHDAVMLAKVCPVAMLFVRCAGGISHNPAEAVAVEDVAAALSVLDAFLDRLIAAHGAP